MTCASNVLFVRRVALSALVVLLMAGCGSGTATKTSASPTSTTTAPATSTPPTTASPTPTTPARSTSAITVGLATTCELMFNSDDPSLATKAITLVSGEITQASFHKANVLATDFESIAARSQNSVRPYLDAMGDALRKIGANNGATVNLEDFKAAGLELIDRCTPYIR